MHIFLYRYNNIKKCLCLEMLFLFNFIKHYTYTAQDAATYSYYIEMYYTYTCKCYLFGIRVYCFIYNNR